MISLIAFGIIATAALCYRVYKQHDHDFNPNENETEQEAE